MKFCLFPVTNELLIFQNHPNTSRRLSKPCSKSLKGIIIHSAEVYNNGLEEYNYGGTMCVTGMAADH